ncbi:MAG: site-2 protease family protein [Anaerolineae bacterium]
MFGGFRVGRFFGINVRVDWSWLLIFFLISWNLAAGFNQLHPTWDPLLSLVIAVGGAILFFLSVLAHELAHSLVARSRGVPVRSITLFLFGGVSNIEREPDSPKSEFLLTIVGPITSLVIGGVLLLLVNAAVSVGDTVAAPEEALRQMSPLATIFLWLGSVNILIGLFNLIPGFPLDGGRILRSILWAVTDNLHRATRWAAAVGQAIGWLMIFGGIAMVFGVPIPFFGAGLVNGVWLAFIGWFLSSAASQSYQQTVMRAVLEDVPVSRLMRTDPPTVPPRVSVSSLVHDYVMKTDEHAFPVQEGGRLVGLVTLEDIRTVPRDAWDARMVSDIMTPADQLITIAPDSDTADALMRMAQRDVRQLPILRDDRLIGLLRRRDIVRWLQLESELGVG